MTEPTELPAEAVEAGLRNLAAQLRSVTWDTEGDRQFASAIANNINNTANALASLTPADLLPLAFTEQEIEETLMMAGLLNSVYAKLDRSLQARRSDKQSEERKP